jgi:tetratricopeptide (TPR) repeat protein
LGDFQCALANFDKAISLDPRSAAAYANKGKVLAELELWQEARAPYVQALALSPNLPEASLGLGQVLTQLGRHNEALLAYDRALSLKPDLAEAWFGRGQALMALRLHGEAYAAFDQVIKLMPELDYGLGKWLHAKMHCCLWDDIQNAYKKVRSEVSKGGKAASPFHCCQFPQLCPSKKLLRKRMLRATFRRERMYPRHWQSLVPAGISRLIFAAMPLPI